MSTNSTKANFTRFTIKRHTKTLGLLTLFIIISLFIFFGSTYSTYADDDFSGLSEKLLKEYSYNNIYFYNPCKGGGGGFSSICGDTPKEKYWSALRQEFDEAHVAAIFGSIEHEGFFGPTLWEYKLVPPGSNAFAPGITWDRLYNCSGANCPGGVGVFQITWSLGPYLQQVGSKNPDLLQYFKDPSYSLTGDQALAKIGVTDYDRLVEQEINFVLNAVNKDSFKATSTLDEAADWWTMYYENCANCCGSADADHSCEQIALRRASARKALDDMKGFSCTASSTPNSTNQNGSISGSDITWIGDSYSVAAHNKGLLSDKYSGADFGPSINTPSSYIQGSKFVSASSSNNPSCLSILRDIISQDKLRPYLVFACGTNGGWTDSDIQEFQNLLKGQDTTAIVVNSKTPKNDYSASNNLLKKMASANDNIVLADWESVYDEHYFDSDPGKIHPYTDPGFTKWVEAIDKALSGSYTNTSSTDANCTPTNDNNNSSDNDVLAAVREIIDLANKNGSTYTWGGGHTTDVNVFKSMLNGAPINVDCTGFASLVMYKAFGKMTSFTSYSIFSDPLYEEVPRSEVRPGDVFAYNSPSGHGGIVVEAKNGVVTKIAETGGTEGRSGRNTNIGYSNSGDFSVVNMNGANGHFFRFKGAK